jgi:hypothetical protein
MTRVNAHKFWDHRVALPFSAAELFFSFLILGTGKRKVGQT